MSIMATIRWCPIFPKWDIYQPLGNLALVSCLMTTHLYRVFAWGRVDEMGHKLAVGCPYPSQISFFTGEVKGRLAYIYIYTYTFANFIHIHTSYTWYASCSNLNTILFFLRGDLLKIISHWYTRGKFHRYRCRAQFHPIDEYIGDRLLRDRGLSVPDDLCHPGEFHHKFDQSA